MFSKKYIFETKRTKLKRYFLNCCLSFLFSSALYIGICIYFIYLANLETNISKEAFYKKSPDLIVIFTGDIGRIPYGIQKALEYENSKIFISGVYTSNSIKDLLISQYPQILEKINLNSNFIEIDYLARNTIENVISTLRYLRMEKNLRRVLIVSSDYHIMRIKFIFDKIKSPTDPYQFNFMGIESNYGQWRSIKILVKEVFKSLKTYGFLLLWDSEYYTQGKINIDI